MPKCDASDSSKVEFEPFEQCFYSDRVLPEAAHLFDRKIPLLKDVINTCIVVLDTNVLLLPYAGRINIEEVLNVYKKIKKSERLFIPAQVAREFNKNRPTRISDMHNALIQKIDNIKIPDIMYSALEKEQEYIELKNKIDKLHEQKKSINESKGNLIRKIQQWTWNDPVSIEYGKIFTADCIIEPDIANKQDGYNDCKERYELKIPPGYKDAAKTDGGIGDYLIWKTILKIGEKNKKHLIFITGDEKSDWQHRSNSHALMPRYELFDEYWRHSNGKSFYICPLSSFLEHQNASKKLVEEIRSEEEASIVIEKEEKNFSVSDTFFSELAKGIINSSFNYSTIEKLKKRYENDVQNNTDDTHIAQHSVSTYEIVMCPVCNQRNIIKFEALPFSIKKPCSRCGEELITIRFSNGNLRVFPANTL